MEGLGILALIIQVTLLVWYSFLPCLKHDVWLLNNDWQHPLMFKQSLAAMITLSIFDIILFIYIRRTIQYAPATRCFVFFMILIEIIIFTLSSLQPFIYWQDTSSFLALKSITYSQSYISILYLLNILGTFFQISYIFSGNSSQSALSDDGLIADVLHEPRANITNYQDTNGNKTLTLWQSKWQEFLQIIKKRKHADPIFQDIVRLYAHREGAIKRLSIAYERHPAEIEFYLPQICSFHLLSVSTNLPNDELCVFLLKISSASHVVAYKILWYFQSYCIGNPAFATNAKRLRIQTLMEEVAERGKIPAHLIADHARKYAEMANQSSDTEDEDVGDKEQTGRKTSSEESEKVALLKKTDHDKYLTFQDHEKLEKKKSIRALETMDPFQLESNFLSQLTDISINLFQVPLSNRNDQLREWLQELQTNYLPSDKIYLPIGNPFHCIKQIHVEESFTFSTRERVPYLLCAEVVEYPKQLQIPEKKHSRSRTSSMFKSLSLWDTNDSSQSSGNHNQHPKKSPGHSLTIEIPGKYSEQNATPNPNQQHPLMSPNSNSGLGFWSEPKNTTNALRNLKTSFSASMAQPGEIIHGLLDTLVRKGQDVATHIGQYEQAPTPNNDLELALRPNNEVNYATPQTALPASVSLPPGRVVARSRGSSLRSFDLAENSENDAGMYSPKTDGSTSPSVGHVSTKALRHMDSFDNFFATESLRASRYEDQDHPSHYALSHLVSDSIASNIQDQLPCVIFKERWAEKEKRIQEASPHGHLPGWRLVPVIIKANDDLRQEQLASQLLHQFKKVFTEAKLPVFVRPYDIIAISSSSGMVEAISDTISIDSLKRNDPNYTSLLNFFIQRFGSIHSQEFRNARRNFVSSMAAYSIICYLLQIKDRHNGNILLDADGHIIHIDFGFMLSNNPGNMAFEQAPFKLTAEFVELMGGPRSGSFQLFRSLCVRSFLVARKYRHRFVLPIEMMINGNENLPCFSGDPLGAVEQLAARFQPELDIHSCEEFVHALIDTSIDNWRTRWYDKYQRWWVGVF